MTVRKFTIDDAAFEPSPGHDGNVLQGNVVDQRHGGPITIGYGRYGPNEKIAVDDVMIILEGRVTVSSATGIQTARPGEIIYMPKGSALTISAHEEGAVTAYVIDPHWQEATADPADPMGPAQTEAERFNVNVATFIRAYPPSARNL